MERNTISKNNFWNNEYFKLGYDLFMAVLAAVIIASLLYQGKHDLTEYEVQVIRHIDYAIWLIFVLDYFVRLFCAEQKGLFLRRNIIDLISIIPLDIAFQGLRVVRAANVVRLLRIFYLFRVFVYLSRLYKRLHGVIATNQFHHVLCFTFFTIFGGAVAISHIEGMKIGDALWWSFVTTTTVGYGDIAPSSWGGRLVAVFLMLVGIGFLGMFTGTIATYFIHSHTAENTVKDETLKQIIAKLEDFRKLSVDDLNDIHAILLALKANQHDKEFPGNGGSGRSK